MIRIALGITAVSAAAAFAVLPSDPAVAQARGEIIVYGNDPCPRAADDEVVVCARRPERERYRLPDEHRPSGTRQQQQSWAARSQSLNTVGSTGINSCSSVGPGGHTGCLQQMINQARDEANEADLQATPPR